MQPAQPIARGIHHLALNTDDMKMTLDFYVGVLGMPLVHALKVPPGLGTGPGNRGNPPFENLRHYFLDAGGDCCSPSSRCRRASSRARTATPSAPCSMSPSPFPKIASTR